MEECLKITVIIPVRIGGSAEIVLDSLKKVDYPQELIEVLVIRGGNPSRQRNEGVKQAKGQIIFFFDDDSKVSANLFKETVNTYSDYPYASGVGGPACLGVETSFERASKIVLTSLLGVGKIRARYRTVGRIRYTDDSELISCNLSIRRDIFDKEPGFDERLYPNEENELISRLIKKGYKFVYNPGCFVTRKTDPSLNQFLRRIFSYGQGRAKQLILRPALIYFIGMFLILFLIVFGTLLFVNKIYFFILFCFYFAVIFTGSLFAVRNNFALLPKVFILYIFTHFTYASGLGYGLIKMFAVKKKE